MADPADPFALPQAEFDSSFAQAAIPQAKTPKDTTLPLPYYPSPRYTDHNLAPETSLSYDAVTALAKARKLAEKQGVLTPELGEQLLPMAMVEGHGGGFGIVKPQDPADTGIGFYAKPSTLKRFSKMDLSIADKTDPANADATANLYLQKNARGEKFLVPGDTDNESSARLMAAILAEKAAIDKSKTTEGAVKLYNGHGRSIETADGHVVPADTDVYWQKVQAARDMLLHPRNAPLMQHFNRTYLRGK